MRIQLYTVKLEWLLTLDIPEGKMPDVVMWKGRAFIRNDALAELHGGDGFVEAIGYIEAVLYAVED